MKNFTLVDRKNLIFFVGLLLTINLFGEIKVLNKSNNEISYKNLQEVITEIENDQIKELTIVDEITKTTNDEKMQSFTEVMKALKNNKSLEKLNLSFNDMITLQHVRELTASLKDLRKSGKLLELNLRWNNLEDKKLNKLIDVWKTPFFRKNKKRISSIQKMNISMNGITDKSIKNLAGVLKKNPAFKDLNLAQNNITDKGAKYISIALKNNTNLKQLNLSVNRIGLKGILDIINIMKTNKNIKIDLSLNNKMNDDDRRVIMLKLKELKKSNTELVKNILSRLKLPRKIYFEIELDALPE